MAFPRDRGAVPPAERGGVGICRARGHGDGVLIGGTGLAGETPDHNTGRFFVSAHHYSVGSFSPNAFGLYDMVGNVSEWVEDCWNTTYVGAPGDGSAWEDGNCTSRVVRGGSWGSAAESSRIASRGRPPSNRENALLWFQGRENN